MKRALITGLLICGTAPLPAQPIHDYCNPNSPWYASEPCNIQRLYELKKGEREGMMKVMQNLRRRRAEVEAKDRPVMVDSRPGHRIAPRRIAGQPQGSAAKEVEAGLEALLDAFERSVRADPNVLLSLPHNELATALMLLEVRSYMVLRGLNDVSPELVLDKYLNWREALRAEANGNFLAGVGSVQFEYEKAVIASVSLGDQWAAAQASGNPTAMSALQKTAEANFHFLYKDAASAANSVRRMDGQDRLDLTARKDNMCPWGGRVTLRFAATPGAAVASTPPNSPGPPVGWRQFDFRASEDFEYQAEGMDGARKIIGTVRIGVRVGADSKGALSIKASLDGETLDQAVGYNLAEGLPLISSLPWAQTGLGQVLASSLLSPRPDLTAEALTSGLDWTAPDGSVKIKTVALGPCGQGPRLTGHLVSTVVTQAAVTNPPLLSCVGLDAPLPIMQKIAWAGGSIEFKLTSRTPAASIPDVAGRPR